MAQIVEGTSWYSKIAELSIIPFSTISYIIRIISWFFITLALAFTIPILGLIVYDFALWIWRLFWTQPSFTVQHDATIRTNPDVSPTSKSQVTGAELQQVQLTDKPASD